MSWTPLDGPPYKFIAGDSVQFYITNPNFPAPTWTMNFVLFCPDFAVPTFQGVSQSNGSFLVTVSAPQTDTILPEEYQAAAVYFNATVSPTVRETIIIRTVWVLPDLTQQLAQSPNQILLASLNAAMLAISAGTNKTFNLNGAAYSTKNLDELQRQIYVTQANVNTEQRQLQELLGMPYTDAIPVTFAPQSWGPPYRMTGPNGFPYGY